MIRKHSVIAAAGMLLLLAATPATAVTPTAAKKLTCYKGSATKVVKTAKCPKGWTAKKPAAKPALTASATSTNPPMGNNVRFAGDTMNSITIRAGLTVTLRNADTVPHTLVIASEGISVLVPANDISAFLAPMKPGTYAMTTAENPNIKGTLVVIS